MVKRAERINMVKRKIAATTCAALCAMMCVGTPGLVGCTFSVDRGASASVSQEAAVKEVTFWEVCSLSPEELVSAMEECGFAVEERSSGPAIYKGGDMRVRVFEQEGYVICTSPIFEGDMYDVFNTISSEYIAYDYLGRFTGYSTDYIVGVLFTRDGSRKVLVGIEGGVYVYTDMAAMGDLFSSETFTSDMSADQAAAVLVKSFLRDGLTLEYDRGSMTTDDLLAKLQSDSSKEDDVDESATASGTGAGRSEWSSSFVGSWALYGASVDGQMISHDDLAEFGMDEGYSLVLSDGGSGVLLLSGEEGEITWEAVSDDEITVKDGVDSVTCTLEGDRLTMKGPDGYEIIFERS